MKEVLASRLGKYGVASLLAMVLAGVGCDDHGKGCPSCNGTVTWSSYDDRELDREGDDGTAWGIVHDCGWHTHGGHEGGFGDTLQIASCGNDGVVLIWAYNDFKGIGLSTGWTGTTKEGVRIGTSVDVFLSRYPGFTLGSSPADGSQAYRLVTNSLTAEATFDAEGQLTKLLFCESTNDAPVACYD